MARPYLGNHPEIFLALGAELCFTCRRRPTDHALTERFYGTIKQEEIYLIENFPREISAREEIGRYIERYHCQRPHRVLMNFTPAHVHGFNNRSHALTELKDIKRRTLEKRKVTDGDVQRRRQGSIWGVP